MLLFEGKKKKIVRFHKTKIKSEKVLNHKTKKKTIMKNEK